jgi:hypothetical protein
LFCDSEKGEFALKFKEFAMPVQCVRKCLDHQIALIIRHFNGLAFLITDNFIGGDLELGFTLSKFPQWGI